MKLCKDCKFHQPNGVRSTLDRCMHPSELDLITGKPILKFCDHERNYSFGSCKKEGRNFVPIIPEPVDMQPEVQHNQSFFSKIVKFFKRS